MSEFQDQLDQAFEQPHQDGGHAEEHWSRTIVEELAQWINKKSAGLVYARIEETGVPEGTRLVWGPVTRLGDTSTLLVVSGQGERAIKLGPHQRLFFSREELQADITKFIASDEFRESLAEMMRRAGEPIEGFFRSEHPHDRDPANDVLVEVPPAMQKRLAEAYLGGEARPELIGLRVRLMGPSPIAKGRFQDRKDALTWLVSGGVVVELRKPLQVDGEWLEFSGIVQRES